MVEDAGPIEVSFLKTKGEDFHLGPRHIGWEPGGRAWYFDPDFFPGNDSRRIIKPIEDSVTDIFDDPFKLDKLAVTTEIGAALITGVGREKGTVGSNDFIGKEAQAFSDFH